MKCVCEQACFVKNAAGKNQYFDKGQVHEFDKVPTHFRQVKRSGVNFATSGEEELMAADFRTKDLKVYIEENFDRKAGNRGKEKLVEMLMECRFRKLDIDPNLMV